MNDNTEHLKMRYLSAFLSLVGVGVFVILAFQNCAEPLEIAGEDQALAQDGFEFAYDTKIDTISYMSCSGQSGSVLPGAYYSVRAVAAREGSGIGLRPSFEKQISKLSYAKKVQVLRESSANLGTQLQLSIRDANAIESSLLTADGSTANEGEDFDNILSPLDSEKIAQTMANLGPGDRLRYFAGIEGLSGRSVEASLRFMESEVSAQSVRDRLEGVGAQGILSLTYLENFDDPLSLRKKGNASVYGSGYSLRFRHGPYQTSGARRVLRDITEINLKDNSAAKAQWNCENRLVFTVVRPHELVLFKKESNRLCRQLSDPISGDAETMSRLAVLRSVLRSEDWFVDLENNCIVPKNTEATCYGDKESSEPVNYSANCEDNCPHSVSVCYRIKQ